MILGITGSIGGGKSLVTELFSRRGWEVFSADGFCRELREKPDTDFLREVEAVFGETLFDPRGALDRGKIADVVFGEPEKREKYLALVYPRLDDALKKKISECRKAGRDAAFEIPLLFEKNYAALFDAVVAVWSGKTLRRDRLMKKRAVPGEEMTRREALQMPENEKLEKADYGIINCGGVEDLETQIDLLIKQFKSL